MEITEKDKQRFWKFVNKSVEGSSCWNWTGSFAGSKKNYGSFGLKYKNIRAHRFSYLVAFGEILKGLFVLHKCDNPSCVNPDHLEAGDQKKNIGDCVLRGRHSKFNLENFQRGDECSWSKVNSESVTEIRKLNSSGIGYGRLARCFHVDKSAIYQICVRKTWKHINP